MVPPAGIKQERESPRLHEVLLVDGWAQRCGSPSGPGPRAPYTVLVFEHTKVRAVSTGHVGPGLEDDGESLLLRLLGPAPLNGCFMAGDDIARGGLQLEDCGAQRIRLDPCHIQRYRRGLGAFGYAISADGIPNHGLHVCNIETTLHERMVQIETHPPHLVSRVLWNHLFQARHQLFYALAFHFCRYYCLAFGILG